MASGRNHVYDAPGGDDRLQHTRLAHAELNVIAEVSSDLDHAGLTLWSTQHPCSMCAAAAHFCGIGSVAYIADDPSDGSSPAERERMRFAVPYVALGDPDWWGWSNLVFLTPDTVRNGTASGNLQANRDRHPRLVALTLRLAESDVLGRAARAGRSLEETLRRDLDGIALR